MIKSFSTHFQKRIVHRSRFADFAEMGRRKNRNKHNRNNPLPYKTNEMNYAKTTRDNELFRKFYSSLGLMPDEEVDAFYQQMKEPLPVTFRITGYKSQANELLKIIRNQFFNKLITPSADPQTSADEETTHKSTFATSTGKTTVTNYKPTSTEVPANCDTGEYKGGDNGQEEVEVQDAGAGDAQRTKGLTIEGIQPPKCLTWYPDQLAWQIDLSRKVVRSQEILSKLHEFLVSETETGNISRQEAVSMIPPLVLDIKSNSKVLDMCAAPGSKTAQLIEYLHKDENTVPEGFVMANDRENKRCYLMVHQVKRLSSPCCVIVNHDATNFPKIRTNDDDNKKEFMLFDRVLADVPCSGDGTLRKNVDIWNKWNPTNGHQLHGLQLKILKRGLELLEVGGRLVYSTCSMHPVENEAVLAEMLRICQGCVELVDISSYIPGLKTVPGLSKWVLMTKQGQIVTKFDFIPPQFKHTFTQSMFPPSDDEAQKFNLHLCHRILPHHQDTGAFFVAALCKQKHLPWTKEAHLMREFEAKASQEAEAKASQEAEAKASPEAEAKASPEAEAKASPKAEAKANPEAADGAACATATADISDGSDKRKRRGESMQGPQAKKRIFGFKEDPFLFLEPNDQVWPPIREFYGLPQDFPTDQLMYRCEQGPNRSLYFLNKAIRQINRFNEGILKFVNMGVKFVSRSPSPLVPDCEYRITQECLGSLSPLFAKRKVEIRKSDAVTIFSEENPFLSKLSPGAQLRLQDMCPGSVVFVYRPSEGDPEPGCEVVFCGWRGKTSVRSFVGRHERSHSLRLFGQDLSHIQQEVRRMKAERQATWEKRRAEEANDAALLANVSTPQQMSQRQESDQANCQESDQAKPEEAAEISVKVDTQEMKHGEVNAGNTMEEGTRAEHAKRVEPVEAEREVSMETENTAEPVEAERNVSMETEKRVESAEKTKLQQAAEPEQKKLVDAEQDPTKAAALK